MSICDRMTIMLASTPTVRANSGVRPLVAIPNAVTPSPVAAAIMTFIADRRTENCVDLVRRA
jgi:hypothetical protein